MDCEQPRIKDYRRTFKKLFGKGSMGPDEKRGPHVCFIMSLH